MSATCSTNIDLKLHCTLDTDIRMVSTSFIIHFSSGGGYILSKKALRKFVEELFLGNKSNCVYDYQNGDTAMDDIYTGKLPPFIHFHILNDTASSRDLP
jgi:hypothetical protein